MRLALLFALVGCGRIDFDLRGDGALADALTDAWPYACPPRTALPAQLTVSGVTFRYTSNTNMSTPVPNVMVTAAEDFGGPVITQTTSDGVGAYSLLIDTNGQPRNVAVTYAAAGNFTSNLFLGQPLDHDVVGTRVPAWVPGDGPIWNTTQMDFVYSSATPPVTRMATHGTINVAVHDCADLGIAGATVTLDPPSTDIYYQATDGTLMRSDQTIAPPFTHAIVFNAVPGPTRISASAVGFTFPDVTVEVVAGTVNTLAIIRAAE